MTALSHALFYTVLVTTGIISGLFSYPTERKSSMHFEELCIVDNSDETLSLEEPHEEIKRTEYFSGTEKVTLYKTADGYTKQMKLEEYVEGVMLAEMPSWYGAEALKAAAVAVRTYTLYKMNSASHADGADVCDNPSHCQAFYERDDAVSVWSEKSADTALEKIRSAVQSTQGEILVYEGEPILAMYHASGYLKTRSSKEVFGGERAYLQSVAVPFENRENSRFTEKSFSKKEIAGLIGAKNERFALEAVWEDEKCIGLKIIENGKERLMEASRVRSALALSSANFNVSEAEGVIKFEVYGYGHGVGLSQQGAGILAERGWSYDEILLHYYKNTSLANLKNSE